MKGNFQDLRLDSSLSLRNFAVSISYLKYSCIRDMMNHRSVDGLNGLINTFNG